MVVGSMVGAGIFSLPRNFARATGPLGAIIVYERIRRDGVPEAARARPIATAPTR